jgi:two-component system sensor histidine kinase HydH
LRGLSLSLGQTIEAAASHDPSFKLLADFPSRDIAYFSVLDFTGLVRFHSNVELIGLQVEDSRYLALVNAPDMSEELVRLGTGEQVFETQQRLHLPDETMILRLTLHTWQADQIIHRAKAGLTLLLSLTGATWGLGLLALRLQRRDLHRREELAQREHLAQLGELGAVIAHEVRTPLAGIKGFAQLLGERLDDTRQRSYAAKIVSESKRLEELVNDLLTFARQEPACQGISSLAEVLPQAWEPLAGEAATTGVVLQVSGAVDRPVACTQDRLHQVLLNLFTNALQTMPQGGLLRVAITPDQNCVTMQITDSGPGFSPEGLPRVFDPFYTTRANGSGLGLAICRKIVEGCGGTIRAANGIGGGAEITLCLPLAKELT